MKIAVLMSTYNGEKYLDEQLKSLADQTVLNEMTVYIRDDGSGDQTISIVRSWEEKLKIVLFKENNIGPALSFWKLLMNTEIKADYYAFCDQDDIWDENKLEAAIDRLKDDTHLYVCNSRKIDENGNIVFLKQMETQSVISIPMLFVSGIAQGCSMVFTDSLRQYLIEKKIQCIPMHDIILMLYAVQYGKIFWDRIPHFCYRIHSNNVLAKENKTLVQKIKTTCWSWKNCARNSMADVANEMIGNCENLSEIDKEFLFNVADYKDVLPKKIKILTDKRLGKVNKRALRAYRIKVIWNLL